MDKVMASFIIANGAAAMGRPVTMFFTFWGLSVLRKAGKQTVKKPFMEAMFGKMLPRGAGRLKISKMNMGGMGTSMMKKIMKDKNVDSLEDLIRKAMKAGVKIVACTMSMDVMGIREKELIDGVKLKGVGYYLRDTTEGPFLSVPVITELHPQGVPELSRERREALRAAKPAFDRAWVCVFVVKIYKIAEETKKAASAS